RSGKPTDPPAGATPDPATLTPAPTASQQRTSFFGGTRTAPKSHFPESAEPPLAEPFAPVPGVTPVVRPVTPQPATLLPVTPPKLIAPPISKKPAPQTPTNKEADGPALSPRDGF